MRATQLARASEAYAFPELTGRARDLGGTERDAWIYDPRCAKGSLMSMVTNGGVEIAAGHFRGFVGVGTQCDRNFFL